MPCHTARVQGEAEERALTSGMHNLLSGELGGDDSVLMFIKNQGCLLYLGRHRLFDQNTRWFACATRETENNHNHQCKYRLRKHACRSSKEPLASVHLVALVPPDKQSRKQNITKHDCP